MTPRPRPCSAQKQGETSRLASHISEALMQLPQRTRIRRADLVLFFHAPP